MPLLRVAKGDKQEAVVISKETKTANKHKKHFKQLTTKSDVQQESLVGGLGLETGVG